MATNEMKVLTRHVSMINVKIQKTDSTNCVVKLRKEDPLKYFMQKHQDFNYDRMTYSFFM